MKIYCMGDKPSQQASFTMSIAPAAVVQNTEVPAHWVEQSGDKIVPVQFNIEFIYGVAEVEDSLAKFLLQHGLAKRSRLIVPSSHIGQSDLSIDPLGLGH